MKRLLFLIVVLALTIGTLASCELLDKLPFEIPGLGGNQGNGGNEVEETDIQEAIDELNDQYAEGNGASTANDFELVAQMKINGTIFSINWTTDNDSVKLELVDGLWCVDVPEDTAENTTYTLTATITTEGGQEAKVEFTRVLVASFGKISSPEVGKAYKFALLHGNEKKVVYFDGNNYNNYAWYLSYTEDQLAAVDVYLETVEGVEGAYRLYYDKDGEKTYIVAFPRDGDTTKGTLKLDTEVPEEYYTWNDEYDTLVYTSVTGESFYIGSSGTYKSISLSAISYINGATSYVAHLYGAGGEKEELPEQHLPEVPENYTSADLIDALYKLESGQTLEGPYELTGIITSIKYPFDPAYNNVSVVVAVEGREDKPVLCYRLNGGEELKVGDTITVFAGLTNYNGTYETTSGGVIREVIPGDGTLPEQPNVPSDVKGILDALYALADGESVNGTFTITGKITALDNYNNPTIVVEGFENQPVYCYRLTVTHAIGDVITVTATTMKNYGGTYEFMNCTLVENGEGPSNPGDDDETPAASLDLTGNANLVSGSGAQNIFAANGITFTNDKASSSSDLTVQASYAQRAYKGSTIKIEYTGMTKIVLTLDDYSDGKYLTGLDGMTVEGATIVRNNDVVTIYLATACDAFQSADLLGQIRIEKIDIYTGEVQTPDTPTDPDQPENPDYVTEVTVGTAYKFFLEQLTAGKTLYFAGSMDGDYLATTDDITLAVDIFFETTDGGYHIYFMDGETKTYINAAGYIKSNGYLGCHFSLGTEPNCVWTFNSQYGIIETAQELDGKSDTFFAGTYGSYNTFSLSGAYYRDQISSGSQFPGRLVLSEGGNTDTPVDPKPEDPVNPEPEVPTFGVVDPIVGTAYKFGMVQGNLDNAIYYLAGGMAQTYYLATTTDVSAAIDVYLEEVAGGGYYLYTLDASGAKLYINMVVSGTHVNGAYEAAPSTVYTYDAENKTLIASVTPEGADAPADYWFGTRNDKTYTTVGPCAVSYGGFYCQFYGSSEGGNTDTPVEPETPVDPDPEQPVEPDDGVYTIPEVLASAEGTQVVVKGTVSEIYQAWNEQYSNISFYITDADGNRVLVFRTGTLVGIGDQVTVTGTTTLYNEVIQIAQGSTTVIDVAHVCSEFTEATCIAKAVCLVCGKENGELGGHSYTNGVCSVCGHEEGTAEVETITASKTMAELITELGWTSSTTKQSFNLDDVVSVKVNGGNNTGKAYNGDHIRVYATDSPAGTLTISLADGYELVSVKVTTATGTYAFLCVDGSSDDISNVTTAVSGSSVVLNSVKNGSDGKQVRVMAIEVVYKAA